MDVLTINEAVRRARSEGLPISEYTLRRWLKAGEIPVRMIGKKALLFYPNLVSYLRCENGGDIAPATVAGNGIRRIERG